MSIFGILTYLISAFYENKDGQTEIYKAFIYSYQQDTLRKYG